MAALLAMADAPAATIVGVTINSVSSEASPRSAINVVNGSGLNSITGAHVNQPDVSGGNHVDEQRDFGSLAHLHHL